MNYGTARARLTRNILFKLAQETGKDICYRCGEKVTDISEFTIEHKDSWFKSTTPIETFFDLDNIAFSHQKCNSGESNKGNYKLAPHGTALRYKHNTFPCRCELCTEAQSKYMREWRSKHSG